MKLTASREDILSPLQSVIGVVERRQTMPVLANVLLSARDDRLSITGTDLEVELVATSSRQRAGSGDITVPGRKLLDIFKALPEKTSVTLSTEGERVSLKAGRSRFTLSSLPAAEFPLVDEINAQQTLTVSQGEFRRLIDKTHFSMAQQDVRYYLNGMLLETEGKSLRAVATDGHRLALCETELAARAKTAQQVIVPRKGVLELQRILGDRRESRTGRRHQSRSRPDRRHSLHFEADRRTFPGIWARDPGQSHQDRGGGPRSSAGSPAAHRHSFEREVPRHSPRVKPDLLTLQAHNPEQEEAEDQIEVGYKGDELEVGFNVNYLLDALAAIDTEKVEIGLTDANSSCLIRAPGTTHDASTSSCRCALSASAHVQPMSLGGARAVEDACDASRRAELRLCIPGKPDLGRQCVGQDLASGGDLPAGPRTLLSDP